MIGRRADDAQSFEEAWSGRTSRDGQIADLVRFAEELCASAVAEPTPAFRESLRTLLMIEAETALLPVDKTTRAVTLAQVGHPHPVRRRVAGLTAAVLASAGVIGLVSSSASAVPGEMLYSVKRSVESVELALHRDDASRGSFQLARANERLVEARDLSDNPSGRTGSLVASTLDEFSAQAEAGSTNLFSDFSSGGTEKSIQKVNDFAASATAQLATLSGQLPDNAYDSFNTAAQTVSDLATQASALCSACTSADVRSLVAAVTALNKDAEANQTAATTKSQAAKDAAAASATGTEKPIVVVPTVPPTSTSPPRRRPRSANRSVAR